MIICVCITILPNKMLRMRVISTKHIVDFAILSPIITAKKLTHMEPVQPNYP